MSDSMTPPAEMELEPCPFCGEAPKMFPLDPETEGDAWTQIACTSKLCVVQPATKVYGDDKPTREAEAIAAWNTRSLAAHAVPSDLGRLEELLAAINRPNPHKFGTAKAVDRQDADDKKRDEIVARLPSLLAALKSGDVD